MYMQACRTTILPRVGNAPILSEELFYSYVCVFVGLCPLWSGHRMNLGYCHCDPNGQHLAFWLSFLFSGVERVRGGGVGKRWVIWLLVPQAAQLSQLLPLSFLLISPPYASASSALQISVPSIRGCNYYGFVLSGGYTEPFRDGSRFRSCFKSDAVGYIRLTVLNLVRQQRILSSIAESH